MLTELQLRELLQYLESENVERTRAFDKADKMGQAISAFANDLANRRQHGYLLLGVENDGRISGRKVDDELFSSLGSLKTDGSLLPPPAMAMELFHLTEGDVVVIEVFPSKYPPIRYKGQAWVRVGARKALATDEDIHILEERRNQYGLRFEEMPCESAELQDLDLDLFRTGYLPKAIVSDVIESDSRSVQEQLASLRFWNRKTYSPTNLGMILFGKHPELHIPSAYIQYVRFDGKDNGSEILAEHAFKGPLLKSIMDLNGFIKAGLAAGRPVKISPLQEVNVFPYPDWAIRELLLNAIIHRDYQIGNAPTKFYEYEGQRLEISNPGGLYGQATVQNFPYVSDYRNPLLAEAMKVMGLVNKFNRGISKVKTELENNGNPAPVFDVNHITEFRVTLLPSIRKVGTINGTKSAGDTINDTINDTKSAGDTINDTINDTITNTCPREKSVLELISTHPGITKKYIAEHLHVSTATVSRILAKMTADPQKAKIEHRGSNKTGGWFART